METCSVELKRVAKPGEVMLQHMHSFQKLLAYPVILKKTLLPCTILQIKADMVNGERVHGTLA